MQWKYENKNVFTNFFNFQAVHGNGYYLCGVVHSIFTDVLIISGCDHNCDFLSENVQN